MTSVELYVTTLMDPIFAVVRKDIMETDEPVQVIISLPRLLYNRSPGEGCRQFNAFTIIKSLNFTLLERSLIDRRK